MGQIIKHSVHKECAVEVCSYIYLGVAESIWNTLF